MGLLKSVDKSIMNALSPQAVLDIYASLTANAQIERFSARNQAAIHRAANEAALYLGRLERWGEVTDLPNFGSFAFAMQVGPTDDEREDTEDDVEGARIWYMIASDNVGTFLRGRNWIAIMAEEVARITADDEREEW